MHYINSEGGKVTNFEIWQRTVANGYKAFSKTSGVRPVFILNSNVIVTDGDGTEDNPYKLGVE